MQIRLTVVDPLGPTPQRGRAASRDVLVTAPTGTELAAVASTLAGAVTGEGGAGRETGGASVVLYAGAERLDPRRCTLGEPPLVDGAVLSLGAPAAPEPHPELDDAPTQLHVVAGPDAGGVHLLHGGRITVGRSADADVPLDDPDVSRLHCVVTVGADGRVSVADLGSTNGTSLDGTRVTDRPVRFPAGGLLRIGESALRVTPSGGPGMRVRTVPDGEGCVRIAPEGGDGGSPDTATVPPRPPATASASSASALASSASAPAPAPASPDGGQPARGVPAQHAYGAYDSAGWGASGGGPGAQEHRRGQSPVVPGQAGAPSMEDRGTGSGASGRQSRGAGSGASGVDGRGAGFGASGVDGRGAGSGAAGTASGVDGRDTGSGAAGLEGRGTGSGAAGTASGVEGRGMGSRAAGLEDRGSGSGASGLEGRGTGAGAASDVDGWGTGSGAAGTASGADTHAGRFGAAGPGRTPGAAYSGAQGGEAPRTGGRKGTPVRGTDVPRGIRPGDTDAPHDTRQGPRRRGLGAWARRLAGGRGEQPTGPTTYDGTAARAAGTPAAGVPRQPETWPDPAALLLTALGPGPRLWERGPGHPEALTVRLGTADRSAPDGSSLLPAVPVTAALREAGALGLAGPRPRLSGLARAVLAQLTALHSPDLLEIVLISADHTRPVAERTAEWGWLGWLPHVRPGHGQDCRLLLAYDREQAAARTEELLRRVEDHAATGRTTAHPATARGADPNPAAARGADPAAAGGRGGIGPSGSQGGIAPTGVHDGIGPFRGQGGVAPTGAQAGIAPSRVRDDIGLSRGQDGIAASRAQGGTTPAGMAGAPDGDAAPSPAGMSAPSAPAPGTPIPAPGLPGPGAHPGPGGGPAAGPYPASSGTPAAGPRPGTPRTPADDTYSGSPGTYAAGPHPGAPGAPAADPRLAGPGTHAANPDQGVPRTPAPGPHSAHHSAPGMPAHGTAPDRADRYAPSSTPDPAGTYAPSPTPDPAGTYAPGTAPDPAATYTPGTGTPAAPGSHASNPTNQGTAPTNHANTPGAHGTAPTHHGTSANHGTSASYGAAASHGAVVRGNGVVGAGGGPAGHAPSRLDPVHPDSVHPDSEGPARRPSWAREDAGPAGAGGFAGPYTVVVVDGDPGGSALRDALARLAVTGPRAGIHVVCLAETEPASPASPVTRTYEAACEVTPTFRHCGAVAVLSGDVAAGLQLLRVAPGGPVGPGTPATVDAVSAAWAERFARALAPLRPDGPPGEPDARVSAPLPQSARLLDELGLARATPASLMARWADAADDAEALGGRARAVLGAGPRGPLTADLVADGPHLLIEGPVGSGRTELLRAVVTSLAAGERPDRLAVVLLDGRDGVGTGAGHGEGLRACTDIPHVTTHLIANDPVRMREFAQSLTAELKRRAELLGRTDFARWHAGREVSGRMVAQRTSAAGDMLAQRTSASASGDIEAPPSSTLRLRPGAAARRRAGAAPPLPRLVVVVDDLDALVSPALGSPGRPAAGSVIRALEAVAREGERLGVHLVAAAAAGGRTAESETARRAALRVVLDAPQPGPDQPAPGRGRLAYADGRTVGFQGGRVTGRIPRTATQRPTVVPLDWQRMGDPPARRPVRELGNGPTDLALLASAVERAAREVAAAEVPSLL